MACGSGKDEKPTGTPTEKTGAVRDESVKSREPSTVNRDKRKSLLPVTVDG
jgi:hypothetical protein